MKLRIWWVPQISTDAFYKEVNSLGEAKLLLDTLAEYDQFQFANNIKPDYSNAGGLEEYDEQEGWIDWNLPDELASKFDGTLIDDFDHDQCVEIDLYISRTNWDTQKKI